MAMTVLPITCTVLWEHSRFIDVVLSFRWVGFKEWLMVGGGEWSLKCVWLIWLQSSLQESKERGDKRFLFTRGDKDAEGERRRHLSVCRSLCGLHWYACDVSQRDTSSVNRGQIENVRWTTSPSTGNITCFKSSHITLMLKKIWWLFKDSEEIIVFIHAFHSGLQLMINFIIHYSDDYFYDQLINYLFHEM